jgi:FXSXX-COOH protein
MPETAPLVDPLPDLEDMALADLLDPDNPVLAEIMRRIAADDDESSGIVAGFQSAI